MTPRTLGLTDPLHDYLMQVGFREHPALKRVREETAKLPGVHIERCHALVRLGGLTLIDNTLWSGSVADDSDHDPSTEAVRAFNVAVHGDPRVEVVLLPIGDGLTLARKLL